MNAVRTKQQYRSERAAALILNHQTQSIQDFLEWNAGRDHLVQALFTHEQRLGSFAIGDVNHSAHYFNEIAGRAENRITSVVNVRDGAIWKHKAILHFKRDLLTEHPLLPFHPLGSVIRMNPLE